MGIERVGIVGGGQMGAGIAEVCAKAGVDVAVHEVNDVAAAAARARIEKSLAKAVDRGKLDEVGREAALELGSVWERPRRDERSSAGDRGRRRERGLSSRRSSASSTRSLPTADAILASNTSSIPIVRIAQATARPESVVGMHFFNPATVMPLVEIVRSVVSSDASRRSRCRFA